MRRVAPSWRAAVRNHGTRLNQDTYTCTPDTYTCMQAALYESTRRSGPPAGPSGRLPAGEAVRTLTTLSPLIWWKSNSHNLVAEPGFEEMDIVLPKSGFFTLYWQQRTGCMPFKTSHEAHVPALHW